MIAVLFMLIGCQSPPVLKGQVHDIWGHPVEGATVMIVGQTERPLTDANGTYEYKNVVTGEHELRAGKEGYIQAYTKSDLNPDESGQVKGPTFELYPKPENDGMYIVTTGHYEPLVPEGVLTVGHDLQAHYGLKSHGDVEAEGTTMRIVFHTQLKLDEIHRLGLELHKLKYTKDVTMPGPLSAATQVEVNLWESDSEIPVSVEPMRSRSDYLITTQAKLEPGVYALQTGKYLDPKTAESFSATPEELRVVFPFQLR